MAGDSGCNGERQGMDSGNAVDLKRQNMAKKIINKRKRKRDREGTGNGIPENDL